MNKELIQAIAKAIDSSSIDIFPEDVTVDNDDVELTIQCDKKDPTKLVINEWHSQWYSDDPHRQKEEDRVTDSKSIYHSLDDILYQTFEQATEWSEQGKQWEAFESLHTQILQTVEKQYQKAIEELFVPCVRCGNDIECPDNSLCDWCLHQAEKDRV